MLWSIQHFNQCAPLCSMFVSSPVSWTLFQLPFCRRGQSFPTMHRDTSVTVQGQVFPTPAHAGSVQAPSSYVSSSPVARNHLAFVYSCIGQPPLQQCLPSPPGEVGFFSSCLQLPLQSTTSEILSITSLFPGVGGSFLCSIVGVPPLPSAPQ